MSNLGNFILSIDTTSRRGSLAIAREGRIVALLGLEAEAQQSAVLWSDIDTLLGRVGASIDDVTAFAVTRGPGAFTGLRVGLAAAAGLARATGGALYGATSLEVTARAAGAHGRVWAVLNAYRNEVYAQPFRVDASGALEPLADPVVEAPEQLFARFDDGPLRLVGSGADAYAEALEAEATRREIPFVRARVGGVASEGWALVPAAAFLAAELAAVVFDWIAAGREPVEVEPCYVRPSEAEVNLKAGRLTQAGATRGR